jgi:hypothetical protein
MNYFATICIAKHASTGILPVMEQDLFYQKKSELFKKKIRRKLEMNLGPWDHVD